MTGGMEFHQAETQLAWSAVQPEEWPAQRHHHDWVWVWKLTAMIALSTMAILAGCALMAHQGRQPGRVNVSPVPGTTSVPDNPFRSLEYAPEPTVPAMPPDVGRLSPDGQYLQALVKHGLTWTGSTDAAIQDAHTTCAALRRTGMKPSAAAVIISQQHDEPGMPPLSPASAFMYVLDAVRAYCPEQETNGE